MAIARSRSFIGIGKEATRTPGGVVTPVVPAAYIPVKGITPFDNITYLDDENWRGSMVTTYGTVQGPAHSEFEFAGDVFADTIGYPLAGVLGDYAKTGASAPYTHTMAVKNTGTGQATSYTISDYNGYNTRQWSGLQFSEAAFTFSADGLLEYTAKGMGLLSGTTTDPAPSFTTVTPTPVWIGKAKFAGSQKANLSSGDITIKRDVTPLFTVNNTVNPYQLWQGPVSVEGNLTLVMEDDTQLNYYLLNTQPSLELDFTQGVGAALTQLDFFMTKCAFVVGKVERSKDYVELQLQFKAIANTTDVGSTAGYSPVKVTIQNAISTAAYA